MTQCPKCGAVMLVTTAGEICQNCGWGSFKTTRWALDNTVNLPIIIPTEPLENRTLENDINDLTTRVSALETDLEREKKEVARLKSAIQAESFERKMTIASMKDTVLKSTPYILSAEGIELKPCPFCDSIDIGTYEPTMYEVGDDASVECQKCGAEIRASTLKEAITKWNRRAN